MGDDRKAYFDITGGEPFLVEPLFELLEEFPLEKTHARFQTNGTVYRRCRPSHLNLAYQSTSMAPGQVRAWWDNLSRFMDDGHDVTVQLIALPDRLDELENLFGRVAEFVGPGNVYVRYLQGQYGNRILPSGYTRSELARIKPMLGHRAVEEEFCRLGTWDFRGRPCLAGKELCVVFENGDVYRCTGSKAVSQGRLGSLADGFSLSHDASPCSYPCSCIFQGFWYCVGV